MKFANISKLILALFWGLTLSPFLSLPAIAEIKIDNCTADDAFCEQEKLPFQNYKMPEYTVKLIPSNTALPSQLFDLSHRAMRILPAQLKKLKTNVKPLPLPKGGIVEISTQSAEGFCDSKQEFCWFKKLTLTPKQVLITGFDGSILAYPDTIGLYRLFWNESLQ